MVLVPLLLLGACSRPVDAPAPPIVTPTRADEPLATPGEVAVSYRVDLTAPHTGLVRVEATFTTDGRDAVELMMPVWTPGSYLVREYARHVEQVEARGADGAPLAVDKTAKNRWRVATAGHARATLGYTLYARELSVRSNHVDADRAILNGAATFLVPVDRLDRPLDVTLALPESWSGTETSLRVHPEGGPHRYRARDFDELVDAPILAGTPVTHDFVVRGVPHRLVDLDGQEVWDSPRAARDVQRVTEAIVDFWGFVPYERYLFLNVLGTGRGGLEHHESALMLAPRTAALDEGAWRDWLGLVSHELFHAWNVKKLRPKGLGPFDYEREVYTTGLWVSEGLTSYYDDLLLVRGGLIDPTEHLARLSATIADVQGRPGRLLQPLARSSYDAWIEHYRPDEHSPNASVSYYGKGALVGWLLDVAIRSRSDDRRSLDDALRALYARCLEDGFDPADVATAVSEAAGDDLSDLLAAMVERTDELDYGPALDWLGLRFAAAGGAPAKGWLGLHHQGGVLTEVRRGTPAWDAGLDVGDEVLAIDDRRFDAANWARLAQRYAPGDTVDVLVARKGRLRRLSAVVGTAPRVAWTLEPDPRASTAAVLRRERWWGRR